MAYLRQMRQVCGERCCAAIAVVELVSNRNEVIDQYCRKHGQRRLKEQEELERPRSAPGTR